jgi:hypothetical protein
MVDTWEMTHFGDLSHNGLSDTDSDGLSDLQEYQRGTNPTHADTDGDGMPDGWEVHNMLNPLLNNALADADGDGLSNLQEYLSGTDPRSFTVAEAVSATGIDQVGSGATSGGEATSGGGGGGGGCFINTLANSWTW